MVVGGIPPRVVTKRREKPLKNHSVRGFIFVTDEEVIRTAIG
jgi:hypothetical protein